MNRTTITLIVLGLGLGLVFATGARADTIETLERERAQVIEALLSPDLEPAARQAELGRALPRLVDLERLVLRDDSSGAATPVTWPVPLPTMTSPSWRTPRPSISGASSIPGSPVSV